MSRSTAPAAPNKAGNGEVAESVRRLPAASLRPFVAWYTGYRLAGAEPGRHRGLPSPYLTLIITLDDPLNVAVHPDRTQPAAQFSTLVGGLHTSPAVVTHPGRQSGVQLGLTPRGARALLGMPAAELAGIDVSGADILGSLAAEWQERLLAAANWPDRFAVLDHLLLRRGRITSGAAASSAAGELPAEIASGWRRILAGGGRAQVADVAAETGWSTRHFSGRFQAEIGLNPKAAARVVRFHRARMLLWRRVTSGDPPALADLAAACGYYDQAHLARDFRALAGCPPSQLLVEEFRSVQALTDLDGQDFGT